MTKGFDYTKADSQGTALAPLAADRFDLSAWAEYEAQKLEGCRAFEAASEGVAVYRRFRVPEVFSWGCREHKMSLEWQLAALEASRAYEADIPNFLEPWYGIGTVSSAFGITYEWYEGQAPAVRPRFTGAREAIEALQCPVAESPVGREVMERIGYFLEATGGRVPMSISDTQSPLNIVSSYLLEPAAFMFEIYDNPEDLAELFALVASLEREFIQAQAALIGPVLARPGHGFASCREFSGLGFSDDNIMMIGDEPYGEYAIPALTAAAGDDAPVFHSCGNWTSRSKLVLSIPRVAMADAAVGPETDPDPNPGADLAEAFASSGVTLHVRIVGDAETVLEELCRIRRPGLKLIVATYCETPQEQAAVMRGIEEEEYL